MNIRTGPQSITGAGHRRVDTAGNGCLVRVAIRGGVCLECSDSAVTWFVSHPRFDCSSVAYFSIKSLAPMSEAAAPGSNPEAEKSAAISAVSPAIAPAPGSDASFDVFAGSGLGLLLGIIAGLSVSPVVQTILAALVTILTGFLGVQSSAARSGTAGLRIGSFGFACVVGIVFGLYVRTTHPFESIRHQELDWEGAGYSASQAREFVAFERLGFKPKDQEVVAAETTVKAGQSDLFDAPVGQQDACTHLDPVNFDNPDPKANAADMLQQYGQIAGWKDLAAAAQNTGPAAVSILEAAYKLACRKTTENKK